MSEQQGKYLGRYTLVGQQVTDSEYDVCSFVSADGNHLLIVDGIANPEELNYVEAWDLAGDLHVGFIVRGDKSTTPLRVKPGYRVESRRRQNFYNMPSGGKGGD